MSTAPFLAVPIRARISAEGMLLSADPPLWRLHFLAGGEAEGTLAIPGLVSLAAVVLRMRMGMERPILAADEENDVELWVEATPHNGVAEIAVTGWRDIPTMSAGSRQAEAVDSFRPVNDEILIDPKLNIVRVPSSLQDATIGQHLGELFVLDGDDGGGIPLIEALNEKRVIENVGVGLVGKNSRFTLNLKPQFASDGHYLGHSGTLQPVSPELSPLPNAAPEGAANLKMGRQFASVLKQPLSRIVANAETIGGRLHGPLKDNYAEYAQDIANAARHLSELVSDIEDLEAIDRPDFSVARDRIELGDIARRVRGLLALKASDHGINLHLQDDAEKVEAIGEFRRVLQILLNLVGNAIRYAPDGTTVTVTIEKQAGLACICVADEGQGVPTADRERVFDKFERLGRSGDGGSGLGLYISRRLARAMGGDLTVGDAPSGGALFRLSLPAR